MKKNVILFWGCVYSQWAIVIVTAIWGGENVEGKETYLEIAERTGASTATISRVNRSLNYGNDGYDLVFERIKGEENERNW